LWHAKEKLTAFLELESAICACGEFVFGKRDAVPGNFGTVPNED